MVRAMSNVLWTLSCAGWMVTVIPLLVAEELEGIVKQSWRETLDEVSSITQKVATASRLT